MKTRIRDLGDLNLLEVDLQYLSIFFKGVILKEEMVFGDFKDDDFRHETKFHVFIRAKPTKEVLSNNPKSFDNKLEAA